MGRRNTLRAIGVDTGAGPFIPNRDQVRGFILDAATGRRSSKLDGIPGEGSIFQRRSTPASPGWRPPSLNLPMPPRRTACRAHRRRPGDPCDASHADGY